jgi:hypothetical protein
MFLHKSMSICVWTFLQLGNDRSAAGCCQGVGPQFGLTFCIVANFNHYLHLRQIEFKITVTIFFKINIFLNWKYDQTWLKLGTGRQQLFEIAWFHYVLVKNYLELIFFVVVEAA